jgi:hypothetical protein
VDRAALRVLDHLTGAEFEPTPVKVLRRDSELDNEVAGEVLGLDLTTLLLPEAEKRGFLIAHDDSRIGTTNESLSAARSFCVLYIRWFHEKYLKGYIDQNGH